MDLIKNTILITGGTSGIGYELASQLLARGNTVIITGRDQAKLNETKKKLPDVYIFQSDVSDPKAVSALYKKLTVEFPNLNMLINNAGIMRKLNIHDEKIDLEGITQEIEINLNGPIRMTKQFLPHLKNQKNSAIVNVSSGLAFVPFAISPVYSATKAAIHSFSQSLRLQLKRTKIQVFELAPPGTETPLFRGKEFNDKDLNGMKGMDVKAMVQLALKGIEKDQLEIRPGLSNVLKFISRVAPNFGVNMLGKAVDTMLDES